MKKITKHGHSFWVRDKSDEYVINERPYTRVLELSKGDIWLDAGGHIGKFAIDVAEHVTQVYSFEPTPESFDLLCDNIELNEIKNVTAVNAGLWDKQDGNSELWLHDSAHAMNTMNYNKRRKLGKAVPVLMRNYLNFVTTNNINKIKIDTEGGEVEAFVSLLPVIDTIEEMAIEYHTFAYPKGREKYPAFVKLLNQHFSYVKAGSIWNGGADIICRK